MLVLSPNRTDRHEGEHMRALRIAAAAMVTALMTATLAGCSSQPPTTWIGKSASQVLMLDWVDANGSISGTADVTDATKTDSGDPTLTTTVQVTGTESGGKISLRFGGSILGVSASGSISGNSLTLGAIGTLKPGTSEDYSKATTALASSVTRTRNDAAQAQAAADLASATTALDSAMDAVSGDVSRAKKEKHRAALALAKFQTAVDAASAKGCDNGEDDSPAGEASMGASSVGSAYIDDVDSLQTDMPALNDAMGALSSGTDEWSRANAIYASAATAAPALNAYSTTLNSSLTDLSNTLSALPYC